MGRACWLVQTMMIILSGTFLTRLCSFDPCVTSHPWVAAPPLSEEAGSLLPVGPGVVDGGLVIACWSLAPLHLVRQQLAARWRPVWSAHALATPTHRRCSGLLFQRLQDHNQSVSPTMMRTIAPLYSVIQLTWIMCCDIFTHFNYPAPLSPESVRLIWECTN